MTSQPPEQQNPYGPPPQPSPSGYGPPNYGQPYYGGQNIQPRTTNGLAIAALVLGILWIWWLGSILALIFGYVARKQIRERNQSGDGMAIAGIVLGWIGIGTLLLFMGLWAVGTSTSTSGY